jgi:hypothetical protein
MRREWYRSLPACAHVGSNHQRRGKGHMHDQHRASHRVKSPRADRLCTVASVKVRIHEEAVVKSIGGKVRRISKHPFGIPAYGSP